MNQRNLHENDQQTESVADLPLTSEQAALTKGGAGFTGGVRVAVGDIDSTGN